MHDEGCVNKCYLSAESSGLSELSQLKQGANGFNWHISYLDAAQLWMYWQSMQAAVILLWVYLSMTTGGVLDTENAK